MAIGSKIETRGHIVGFREEIQAASGKSADDFFTWFDSAADADASFVRGQWDFSLHIAPFIAKYVPQPETKTILEIGYGGGRILAAAARSFRGAVGVDIHDEGERVKEELAARGVRNIELFKCDGATWPCPDGSVDAVYTFIVLQHVEKIAIWKSCIQETVRVLKPGGVAMLYFGRWAPVSLNRPLPLAYWAERLTERFFLPQGYKELQAHVNDTNLHVTLSFARKELREAGFRVLDTTVSRKKVPDGLHQFGSQHGLLVQKI